MCGIVGFIEPKKNIDVTTLKNIIGSMSESLRQRGPDSGDIYLNNYENVHIALGHRRLAILDLSEAGNQPMKSKSGRYVIVFNGEIYNHQIIRKSFPNEKWGGESDTETILTSIEELGLENSIFKFKGMFAFALYDTKEGYLYLVRDRFGEKPLYYGLNNNIFLFSSELKAFNKHPSFSPEIDNEAVYNYLKYSYIPTPKSIYKNIHKLTQGSYIKINLKNLYEKIEPVVYWDTKKIYWENFDNQNLNISDETAVYELENKLRETILLQQISDVPSGCFLSGGIDSSLIASIMQSTSKKRISTFTIGFNEQNYNEAIYAKKVALHLGTDHNELYLSGKQSLDIIPELSKIYDEPFADSSQIPTILLCQMTKKYVTVSLSGDGGDEMFGGYTRYIWGKHINNIPYSLRSLISFLIGVFPPNKLNHANEYIINFIKLNKKFNSLGDKLYKLKSALEHKDKYQIYQHLISTHSNPNEILKKPFHQNSLLEISQTKGNFIQQSMLNDILTYLTDDILVKVDRASMFSSLETRTPFLDHDMAMYSWSLPMHLKIRGNKGKWILKEILKKHITTNLIDRPKMGFGVPIDSWLRGPLKDWSFQLINNVKNDNIFDITKVNKIWEEHQSGKRNWQAKLWNILMFQSWYKNSCIEKN